MKLVFLFFALLFSVSAFCSDLCVGDHVVTSTYVDGWIKFIYPDGTADVGFENGNFVNKPLDTLAPFLQSYEGYRLGDYVVTNTHVDGIIVAFFPQDDTAKVRFESGYEKNYAITNIALAQRCSGGCDDTPTPPSPHRRHGRHRRP
jgi:hypothetical protein